METNFNFKSGVCTSRFQSERLLALGLKKETADMHWFYTGKIHGWQCCVQCYQDAIAEPFRKEDATNGNIQPAWSLHRLLSLIPREFEVNVIPMCGRNYEMPIEMHILPDFSVVYSDLSKETYKGFYYTNIYDSLISCIEWQVEQGYFPKEYLEE